MMDQPQGNPRGRNIQKILNPTRALIESELDSVDSEADYHNHIAPGSTDIKYFEQGVRKFRDDVLNYEPDEAPYEDMDYHMKIGTMVEQALMEPHRFEQNFIEREDMNTPSSPNQREFADLILTGECSIEEAHDIAYVNSSKEKAQDLYNDLRKYIQFQKESAGIGVYTKDEYETVLNVCNDIISHKRASSLLINDEDWEKTWTQVPVMGEINGVLCKGLIDKMVYDGDKILLIDLKVTSKPVFNFGYYYTVRKYYRQKAHYIELAKQTLTRKTGQNFDIEPVVVISSKEEPYGTAVKRIPQELIREGREELHVLLHELKWHIRNNKWDRPKSYYTEDDIGYLNFDMSDIREVIVP